MLFVTFVHLIYKYYNRIHVLMNNVCSFVFRFRFLVSFCSGLNRKINELEEMARMHQVLSDIFCPSNRCLFVVFLIGAICAAV